MRPGIVVSDLHTGQGMPGNRMHGQWKMQVACLLPRCLDQNGPGGEPERM